MPDPSRLVLLSSGSDDWLRSARRALEGEEPISTEQDVLALWTARTAALDSIEIISHAVSKPESQRNCLRVGDWTLDETAFKNVVSAIKSLVDSRSKKPAVYIFGCLTAEGTVACGALAAMEQALGLPVYGTTRVCGTYDLEPESATSKVGVKRNAPALWDRPTVKRAPRAAYAVNAMTLDAAGAKPRDINSVRGAFGGDLPPNIKALLDELLGAVDPAVVYEFPGMLTLPTRSVEYSNANERGQIDSLFENRMVRLIRETRSLRRIEYLFPVSSRRRENVERAFAAFTP